MAENGVEKSLDKKRLKERVRISLAKQGYTLDKGKITTPEFSDKDAIRSAHAVAVAYNVQRSRKGLEKHEERLLNWIANGWEVQPKRFAPRLIEVQRNTEEELLFRYARLHWSIPVSAGYGRRVRFLVIDEHNGKLVGILGLGDPVFALKPRDRWIGWSKEEQRMRLRAVMDAYVLGAVPPYSFLLGGKLIAMLATSNEARKAIEKKYRGNKSRIRGEIHDGHIALITTTSALGRSSIYNRLRFEGRKLFYSVGYTKGSGDFHFTNGLYNDLRRFVEENFQATAKHDLWGGGFRNRREVVRKALVGLGMQADLTYHGVRREIFVVPLARNTKEYLQGKQDILEWHDQPADLLTEAFIERWFLPRAQRDIRYRDFNRERYRIW